MISERPLHPTPIALSFLFILVAFAVLEIFWLGWFATDIYQHEMRGLLRQDYITWPWIAFYSMYASVIFMLAVYPNRAKSWLHATLNGALLGLASYGAYNLTNYSIIQGFTLKIMLIDWFWGIFLTGASALAGWWGFQVRK